MPSFALVSLACLPLYIRADILQEKEKEIQSKLAKKVNSIKKNFKGDERLFLLQTYYKQNNYHPIMGLRLSLSLLLQIPIFIAAYTFFNNLQLLHGLETYYFQDLSQPDELIAIGDITINYLPILMTIINLAAGFVYSKNKSFKENKLLICMSLFFLILLYNSPAALVLYWVFNNVFSLIKNIFMIRLIQFVPIMTPYCPEFLKFFLRKKDCMLIQEIFLIKVPIGVIPVERKGLF